MHLKYYPGIRILGAIANSVNPEMAKKMAKGKRKRAKAKSPTKRSQAAKKGKTEASEYVRYLLELHKLQGVILTKLDKEL